MFSLQSPTHHPVNTSNNNNNNNKHFQLLNSNISPTNFRNKRIPSSHDNYSYSSNQNLKVCRMQSPSNPGEKLKRRKSQYINSTSTMEKNEIVGVRKKQSAKSVHVVNSSNHNNVVMNNNISIHGGGRNNNTNTINNANSSNTIINTSAPNITTTTISSPHHNHTTSQIPTVVNTKQSSSSSLNIIQQMNCLKNQYKQLKLAYQELIEERINNSEKMSMIKEENRRLEMELEVALGRLAGGGSNRGNVGGNGVVHIATTITNSNAFVNNPPTTTTALHQSQLQHQLRQQISRLKQLATHQQQQLNRIKKQCYKLIAAERFKSQKLQLLLEEKEKQVKRLKRSKDGKEVEEGESSNSGRQQGQGENIVFNRVELNRNVNTSNQSLTSLLKPTLSNRNIFQLITHQQQPLINSTPKLPHLNSNIHQITTTTNNNNYHFDANNNIQQQSLFISQDKSILSNQHINIINSSSKHYSSYNNNQSQFISISLTSVMESSICYGNEHQREIQSKIKDNCQHLQKVTANGNNSKEKKCIDYLQESTETVLHPHANNIILNSNINVLNNTIADKTHKDILPNPQKQPSSQRRQKSHHHNTNKPTDNTINNTTNQTIKQKQIASKKTRKQIQQKLQLNLNHIDKKESLFSLKTPINSNSNNNEKKFSTKHKNSKSKRKQQDKQNYQSLFHGNKQSNTNDNIVRNMKKQKDKQKSSSLYHK